jgi:hypothetical protein
MQDALTKEEALRGMTIWAAKSAFEEHMKGSLEAGKLADFIVMDMDLLQADMLKIRNAKPSAVYIAGIRLK